MKYNLFVYESNYGTSKRTAEILSLILPASTYVDVSVAPKDITKYNNIILVFGFYGINTAIKIKEYLNDIKDQLGDKKVGIIGLGLSDKDLINYATQVCNAMDKEADFIEFVQGELRVNKLAPDIKESLKSYLGDKGVELVDMGKFNEKLVCSMADSLVEEMCKPNVVLDEKTLKEEIDKFILNHNTCALATGSAKFVRCTPIEYTYHKECLYFITEGGLKFKGIIQNSNVCIGIFNNYTDMNNLEGMQITGSAEIVPYGCEEYKDAMNAKGLDFSSLEDLPFSMHLIKVVPKKVEFLNSKFKDYNVDIKQSYNYKIYCF